MRTVLVLTGTSKLLLQNVETTGNSDLGIQISSGNQISIENSRSSNNLRGLSIENAPSAIVSLTGGIFEDNQIYGASIQGVALATVRSTQANRNGGLMQSTSLEKSGLSVVTSGTGDVILEDVSVNGGVTTIQPTFDINAKSNGSILLRRVSVRDHAIVQVAPNVNATWAMRLSGINVLGQDVVVANIPSDGPTFFGNFSVAAIMVDGGNLRFENAYIHDNGRPAIGRFGNGDPKLVLVDSTVSTNRADRGIQSGFSDVKVNNSTFSGNLGNVFSGVGRLAFEASTINQNSSGTTLFPFVNEISLSSTIINSLGAGSLFDNSNRVTSQGFNFLSQSPTSWTPTATDIFGSSTNPLDANLEPLANNGGNTPTHLPRKTSPVLDRGSPVFDQTLDQRGVLRSKNATGQSTALPDIGSVELVIANSAPILTLTTQVVTVNEGTEARLSGMVIRYRWRHCDAGIEHRGRHSFCRWYVSMVFLIS